MVMGEKLIGVGLNHVLTMLTKKGKFMAVKVKCHTISKKLCYLPLIVSGFVVIVLRYRPCCQFCIIT